MADGSYLKVNLFTGPFPPPPTNGSYLKLDMPYTFRKHGFRHVGLVRGARG